MILHTTVPSGMTTASEAFLSRRPREARLRAEHGRLYPGLCPGEWKAAAMLADQVLADRLLRGSEAALRGRVLPDTHFEFRGGTSQGGERGGLRWRREGT
jgi:hypothetical protein